MRIYNGTTIIASIIHDCDVQIVINPPLREKQAEELHGTINKHMRYGKIIPTTIDTIESLVVGFLQAGIEGIEDLINIQKELSKSEGSSWKKYQ